MDTTKVKQQIADKIKDATNILITVSDSPSVDALSAALGLNIVLDSLGKHATAIFSGSIPPAISFLNPEKTFESTTDSLRDFIIALDKEKADHLRYKIDGDMVKIFITPYKTTISQGDLEFSQGDYNVELVLALGVENQQHLDKALEAHGQILHDATVVTIGVGDTESSLGSIDWHEPGASSLSEMLVSLVELLASTDSEPLLQKQNATAFLTGIVAETNRFSNTKTSSRVMTIAATLMAAGADQQLIATKLNDSHSIHAESSPEQSGSYALDGSGDAGGLSIAHDDETLAELDARVRGVTNEPEVSSLEESVVQPVVDDEPAVTSVVAPDSAYAPEQDSTQIGSYVEAALPVSDQTANAQPTGAYATEEVTLPPSEAENPHQILVDDKPVSQDTTLQHRAYIGQAPEINSQMNATADKTSNTSVDIFSGNGSEQQIATSSDPLMSGGPVSDPTGIGLIGAQPPVVSAPPELPQPPPLPDFSQLPPPTVFGEVPPPPVGQAQPEILGDILNDQPTAPVQMPPAAPATPAVADPHQFQIPPQG